MLGTHCAGDIGRKRGTATLLSWEQPWSEKRKKVNSVSLTSRRPIPKKPCFTCVRVLCCRFSYTNAEAEVPGPRPLCYQVSRARLSLGSDFTNPSSSGKHKSPVHSLPTVNQAHYLTRTDGDDIVLTNIDVRRCSVGDRKRKHGPSKLVS